MYGGKRSWPNLRKNYDNLSERADQTKNHGCKYSSFPGRTSNCIPVEYEPGVLSA